MRYADCDIRQKRAWKNVMHAASFNIFGLVNTCMDNDPSSCEYQSAFNQTKME